MARRVEKLRDASADLVSKIILALAALLTVMNIGMVVPDAAIPFWLVMAKVLPSPKMTGFVILGFAAVQMVVHMIYFLHMNSKSEGGWVMLAVIFTLIIVVISLVGTLWVMYHLDTNMMPGHVEAAMSAAP